MSSEHAGPSGGARALVSFRRAPMAGTPSTAPPCTGRALRPRHGGEQEAALELLLTVHGMPRWTAIPPPLSPSMPSPAFPLASDAGV
jgi:hypothetical protein